MSNVLAYLLDKRQLVVILTLVFAVLGFFAYQKLPLEAFPDVANMQVRVITQVPGKAAAYGESLGVSVIEKEVNGIPHSKAPRSISISGLSVVTIVFDDEADNYSARQQVLERISHADVPANFVPELDPNASPVGEIFRYTLEGDHWSPTDRKEVQEWLLNRLFKSVDGVVDSTGFGGPTKIYLVELDPDRLRSFKVSQAQIDEALTKSNDSTGGSFIVSNHQRYMVRGVGLLKKIEDIESVVITSNSEGVPIRVMDIATVSLGTATRKGQVGVNEDDDAVEGILMMRRGDNASRVIQNLQEAWPDIEASLPPGMRLEPLYDRNALVKRTVTTISHNVLEGVLLVVLLLMLFLFQVRAALICALVIPLALMFAFIVLTGLNTPANLLSLGAIDFGIIVDGAVIMVENIMRKLTHDDESLPGATLRSKLLSGASEVAKPILFSTAIIVLTFVPILSFQHVEGRLFRPLAIMMNLTLLGAVLAALFVVPVISYCVFFFRPPSFRESPVARLVERLYKAVLSQAMKVSHAVVAGVCIFIVLCSLLVPSLGSEFVPELEEGNIWLTVTVLPASVTLDKSVEIARKIRGIISTYSETKNVLTQIGSPDDGTDPNPYNLIEVLVDLKPQEEWSNKFPNKEALVEAIDKEIEQKIPGLICNFSQCIKDSMEEAMSGVKNGEYAVKVFGPDLKVLESLAGQISTIMKSVPGMTDVACDILLGQPQVVVTINQQGASRFGVTADDVLDVVETSIGGKVITSIVEGERHFDLVLRLEKSYRDTPKQLGEILVSTPTGHRIPLKQVASVDLVEGSNAILRDNNRRRIACYANIRGRDLGSTVMESQEKINKDVKLPEGYKIAYAGEFERAKEAGARLAVVVPITLALIFLLLYFMFDSAVFALLAMSSVPVAAAVAILVCFIAGTHISISSGVGLIALFGLTIQNGVIMLAKIKELIDRGDDVGSSIQSGAAIKLRPIVIAVLVAAAGLAPAALSTGIGSQSQRPFAIVISCGVIPATLISLFFLPALARIILAKYRRRSVNHRNDSLDPFS